MGSTPIPGTTPRQSAGDAPLRAYLKWSGLMVLAVAVLGVVAARILHWLGY